MTKKQKEETAKFCLGLSQLCIGSLVFNAFGQASFILKVGFSVGGLLFATAFYILAMWLVKDSK